MDLPVEISDDDDSLLQATLEYEKDTIILSSDENNDASNDHLTSDEELPSVEIQERKSAMLKNLFPSSKKSAIIKNLFPSSKKNKTETPAPLIKFPNISDGPVPSTSVIIPKKLRDPGVNRMIEGINVNLPVNPYGCQVALMSMLIKAIKRGQNCLLESPTGSGKTLALLCGALGWLTTEKKAKAEQSSQMYFAAHPGLNLVEGATEYVVSPKILSGSPDKFFAKNHFGEKSIYDKPGSAENGSNTKHQPKLEDTPEKGLVRIHNKRKLGAMDTDGPESELSSPKRVSSTPIKNNDQPDPESPQELRVPTIYYGARTHKQLQQVIKEFSRTSYSDHMKMSVLSSREHSCIREFDKKMWGTKNDMCRECVRKINQGQNDHTKDQTNCKYYNNRQTLKHDRLPAAFDLEDLVNAGHELAACPYYAAREMATYADIVFCPYNYIIEPSIRSSLKIHLTDNIVIIDEAHNIEDICRDSATKTFTRSDILGALKELEVVAEYRCASTNQDVLSDIDKLIKFMKNWNDWFGNQSQLLENVPATNNEAVYMWHVEHFVKSLEHHNIGQTHFPEFRESTLRFCNHLQNDPRSLIGVTQSTATLLGSIEMALGYLFRDNGKFKDDYKPVLVKIITGDTDGVTGWRNSQFKKMTDSEALSLRLLCLNPAVVFETLKVAKCIVLASGTLTPLISLHSELNTDFPLKISPSHVIPQDRVWIGTLTTHPSGRALECKSRDTSQAETQDSLGRAVLWVCEVTPNGVLCFVPSYQLMNQLVKRWQETGLWRQLNNRKHVFQESRNTRDHDEIMKDYYYNVSSAKGALLFAVYRGKVSEGMDFKDHQARTVITVGVPYPNTFDMAVKAKMDFNDKYCKIKNLLTGRDWLKVQAYRALNQAVGRCVRHKADWGAVLMIDGRFLNHLYTEHLSKWVLKLLENNHHSFESLVTSPNSLESFMQTMRINENEDVI